MVRASLGCIMLTDDGEEHERYLQPFETPLRAHESERLFGASIREFARELAGRIDAASVDEAICWMPPVALMERWTRESVTLAGVEIGDREFLGVSVIAVNRDLSVFADPLFFDIHRQTARCGLSFSAGEHYCPGCTSRGCRR